MKDIYESMSSQNILNHYGSKLDIKVDISETNDYKQDDNYKIDLVIDNSEFYDFVLDDTDYIDIVVDFSEYYDVQLDNTPDVNIPIIYESKINIKPSSCDYTILTQDEFYILTQNEECIQYQH